MLLREITIKEYRVLKDFTLHCVRDTNNLRAYTLHLIVGVNGTGKSTLLQLLARLFLQLQNEQQRNPPFGFSVSYQLQQDGEVISITNLDDDGKLVTGNEGLRIRRETVAQFEANEHIEYVSFDAGSGESYLPPRVVALTTGNEKEWLNVLQIQDQPDDIVDEELPNPHSTRYLDDLKEWYLQELSGTPVEDEGLEDVQEVEKSDISADYLYLITAEQIPLVTLCGMLVDINDAIQSRVITTQTWKCLSNVMKEARIKALRGFSLRFRMNQEALLEQDKSFILKLRKLAYHTVQIGSDYLLVFNLLTNTTLPKELLRISGGRGFLLFRSLARLAQPRERDEPLLREVNLFLERSEEQNISEEERMPPLHLFKWLSDGEKNFLGRLCLMPLLRDSEALVLLDEPEVHFNDYWKQQLVLMLDESLAIEPVETGGSELQPCHILMTTHSSITLTDVINTDILILKRRNGYTSNTVLTSLETLGADPSDIIVSVFGASSAAGARGVNRIKQELERVEQIEADWQNLTNDVKDKCIKDLEELEKKVGPGYWRFLILRRIHDFKGKL